MDRRIVVIFKKECDEIAKSFACFTRMNVMFFVGVPLFGRMFAASALSRLYLVLHKGWQMSYFYPLSVAVCLLRMV